MTSWPAQASRVVKLQLVVFGKLIAHENTGKELEIVFLESRVAQTGIVFLFPTEAFRVHLPIFPSQASHDTELAPLILGCEIKGVHIHVIDEAVEEITFFSQLCALPGVIAP